jgi:hypothetical protein
MQQRSYHFVSRALAAAAIVLATGCEPQEPKPKTAAFDPEVQRLLQSMNALAQETVAEREFRYDVSPDCTLTAQRVVAGRPGQQWLVSLGAAKFVQFDYAPGLGHGLRAPIDGMGTMESIFDAHSIERIRQMEAMLRSLETTCVQAARGSQSDPRLATRR